jgi:hypothetical protein
MKKFGPTTIEIVDTDYEDRPAHRGHSVEVQGWNSEFVMLVIHSDDGKTNEALISPAQLRQLTRKVDEEVGRW